MKIRSNGSRNFLGIMVINLDSLKDTPFEDDERNRLFYIIDNVFKELVPAEHWMSSVWIRKNYIVMLGSNQPLKETFCDFMALQARLLQKTIREKLQFTVSIGIGEPVCNLNEISKAYSEACKILKSKLLVGKEAILNSELVLNGTGKDHNLSDEMLENLCYAIRAGEKQKSEQLLKACLDCSFKNNCNYAEFQADLNQLVASLLKIIYDNQWKLSDILPDGDYLFEKLTEFRTRTEIEQWFESALIDPLIEKILEKSGRKETKISDEVIKIIENNYTGDISLDFCAQRLKYNPNYISRVFHQETGSAFIAYLSGYRLEKAKIILRDTDMKIQDISELLCYGNSQNFIRYFRKHEQMTPSRYRNMVRKNGTGSPES